MSERLSDDDYRAWIDAGSPNALEAWAIIVALRAEHAKLEGALRDARANGLIYWEPRTERGHIAKARMLAEIDRVLAQPAESGATDLKPLGVMKYPVYPCCNQTEPHKHGWGEAVIWGLGKRDEWLKDIGCTDAGPKP